jgi:hypothetical protein
MKTMLCILALLVLTASTAEAYVRRTVDRGYVVPRYYAGNYGAYRYGLYPYGYYEGTAWGGPVLWPRYYGAYANDVYPAYGYPSSFGGVYINRW